VLCPELVASVLLSTGGAGIYALLGTGPVKGKDAKDAKDSPMLELPEELSDAIHQTAVTDEKEIAHFEDPLLKR